jgi:hypothetical protein
MWMGASKFESLAGAGDARCGVRGVLGATVLLFMSAAASVGQTSNDLSAVVSIDAGEFVLSDFRFSTFSTTLQREISAFKFRVENKTDSAWVDLFLNLSVVVPPATPGAPDEVLALRGKVSYIKHKGTVEGEVTGAYLAGRTPKNITASFAGGVRLLSDEAKEKLRLKEEQEAAAAEKVEQRRQAAAEKAEQRRQAARASLLNAKEKAERDRLAKLPVLRAGDATSLFIGSDRRCAEQFQEALSREGLEKRKRIAELVQYGCGFAVAGGVRVSVQQRGPFSFVLIEEGTDRGKQGWVPEGWLR